MFVKSEWHEIFGKLLVSGAISIYCLFHCPSASADLGVVLADPTTIGVSMYTHAGHSLIYLSGVCAETPLHARLCAPGEQGSVVTTYPNFYEDAAYSWNIVPLSLYIEGFAQPGVRLLYASDSAKRALQAHARTGLLHPACRGGQACPQQPHAYWRDLVGATIDRDVFIYAAHTTRTQDAEIVARLNSLPQQNRYNSLTNNCSNFTENLINAIFPHAVHRDFLNDLAMMSPKAAAHSFTTWAGHHPQAGFYSLHFAQLPGALPRAGLARSGTEDAIHMKKYLIPAALIGDHEVAGSFFVAYYLTGRFGLYKQYTRNATAGAAELDGEAKQAKQRGDEDEAIVLAADAQSDRDAMLGSRDAWASYRARFKAMCAQPELEGLAPAKAPHQFPDWYAHAVVTVDAAGDPWMHEDEPGERTVGLSSSDLLASGSDPRLAVQLMLARVAYALAAKNHYRETMPEFEADWQLLRQAVQRLDASMDFSIASNGGGASAAAAQSNR